ncbi:hypothetical protein NARC_80037 [Candidatus Nitrosocosmicus arcticus]|uniref:Uncharacterized protein n=1 Tax=Candidatus Nitrosocosmicus arcticus TaxID=2035267 RepID=A0A557SUQ4_9ARCH|nr:hypothetical protein NARC_80037 [Candidatus Nitrosocosmicus arcticus]
MYHVHEIYVISRHLIFHDYPLKLTWGGYRINTLPVRINLIISV